MEQIKVHISVFFKKFKIVISIITAIEAFILLFIDKEIFLIKSGREGIIVIFASLIITIIISLVYTLFYRTKVIKKQSPRIKIIYGDIWKEAFSKKKKEKKIVVINVNTTFDMIVDSNTSNIAKPLVSPMTLHGQFIEKLKEKGINSEQIIQAIKDNLSLNRIVPVKKISLESKPRGERECYEKGTIATYEYNNTIFYLLAFSEFDENNNCKKEPKEEMINIISKLIDYYDKHGQGYPIFVPLLGTGMSGLPITKKESLKIITSIFEIYNDKLRGDTTIVVHSKDRKEISLDL